LTADSWVRFEVDGKTEFEGILTEGTQKTLTAEKEITVRAGNAGAVSVSLNNGKLEPMGDLGAVEEKTFSSEQRSASLAGSATN
jgi:Domain of unknown function (DUF4115)